MINTYEVILRLAIGAVFGGIIGFERQSHGRPAGFRTHMLVCVASVLIMIVSEYYYYLSFIDPTYIRIDPARIAAGAITGVGFLGAGVIIKTGVTVQGLTTAACLWIVSAIGLAIGGGVYLAGTIAFIITFFSLWFLRIVEKNIPKLIFRFITITADDSGDEKEIISLLREAGSSITNVDYEMDRSKKETIYNITIALKDNIPMKKILDEITGLSFVKKVAIRS